jgi:hypothetical protein
VVRVKPLLIALTLALAALAGLAVPNASASLPTACSFEGGDTDCRAAAAGCGAHEHTYDVEDHPNVYEADCWGCGLHLGAGQAVRTDCIAYYPPPIASVSTGGPVRYQCSAGMESSFCTLTAGPCHETTGRNQAGEVTYDWRSAGCTTPATGDCGAFTDSRGALRASCSTAYTGHCEANLASSPPLVWCENYGPGGDSSAAIAPPALPCQSGIAGTDCAVGAFGCAAHVGYRTGSSSYEYAAAACGPEPWAPCTLVYVDTTGQVYSCLVAAEAASASTASPPPCQTGFAQDWCDVNAGTCHVHAVTWTAWGDRWVTADCAAAGVACHAEAYLPSLANAHSCGPEGTAAEAAAALPCVQPPPHAGIDCTVNGERCTVLIWLDLNPPNPTFTCSPPSCVFLPPHAGIDCSVEDDGQETRCTILVWLDLGPPNTTFDCLL